MAGDENAGMPQSNEPFVAVVEGEIVLHGIHGAGPSFNATVARQLARDLIAAADELEGA